MWFTGVYIAANTIMSLFLEKQLQQEESVHPRIVLNCVVYLLLFLSVRTNLKRLRKGRYLHLNPHLYAHVKIHFDFSLALALNTSC